MGWRTPKGGDFTSPFTLLTRTCQQLKLGNAWQVGD
jgi:hypothetical protein